MSIDKTEQVITFRREEDPETGQYYGELILRGRLGVIAGILENLLPNHILPAAEELDRQGLETFRTITKVAAELRNEPRTD
jgi:hypothetical protein